MTAQATPDAAPSKRWSREWVYFAVVLCLWGFVPGLRRILDWRAGGFSSVEIVSLLPTLALVPLAVLAFRKRRLVSVSPVLRFFILVWIAAYTYGFAISVVSNNLAAGAYEYTEYLFPLMAAIWMTTQELGPADAIKRLGQITLGIAVPVGIYGLIQYVSPPPWDVAWVINSAMQTNGPPDPFSLRIFSTLNSTGPCADFFVIAILFGLAGFGYRRLVDWGTVLLCTAGLALTLVRSAWLALVAGIVALLLLSPGRRAMFPVILGFAVLTGLLIVTLPSFLGDQGASQVVSRVQTLNDLQEDTSANDRQDQIETALSDGFANPVGAGLGNTGSGTKLSNADGLPTSIDSGFVSRFYELGFVGVVLYLVTIVGSVACLIQRLGTGVAALDERNRSAIAISVAICVLMLVLEAAGDSYYGITGLYFWIALGIGLQARRSPESAGALKRRPVPQKPDVRRFA